MQSITLKQATAAVFGAVVSLGKRCTEVMQRPSEETVRQYLALDPESARRSLSKSGWEIPVTFAGGESADAEWSTHLMAMMLSTRLGCIANVVRRSQSAAGLIKMAVANKHGAVHFMTQTELPQCAISFAFPRNALQFTALAAADNVFAILEDCAIYQSRDDRELIRPLTKFILRHAASLRQCMQPETWCLSPIEYSEMSKELDMLHALPDVLEMVRTFRGGFAYPLIAGLVDRDLKIDPRPLAHKGFASGQSSLLQTWIAMCACEPLAFLHALISLHAPMNDDREAPNKSVMQIPDVRALPSQASSFDYAVELTADGLAGQ